MTPVITYQEEINYHGLPIKVIGEVFNEPIYPQADEKLYSRISFLYAVNGYKIGEALYREEFSDVDLMKEVKAAAGEPEKAINSAIIDIIKKSKDYKDDTREESGAA